ncbi:hypothetical protein K1719_012399 [Acacia pycnantha]|nr:hypothetical protein K1719_012399 [Acacia pycnantha]
MGDSDAAGAALDSVWKLLLDNVVGVGPRSQTYKDTFTKLKASRSAGEKRKRPRTNTTTRRSGGEKENEGAPSLRTNQALTVSQSHGGPALSVSGVSLSLLLCLGVSLSRLRPFPRPQSGNPHRFSSLNLSYYLSSGLSVSLTAGQGEEEFMLLRRSCGKSCMLDEASMSVLQLKPQDLNFPSIMDSSDVLYCNKQSHIAFPHPITANPQPFLSYLFLDSVTYTKLIRSSVKTVSTIHGKLAHAHMIKTSFQPCLFLLNNLLYMYSKCGELCNAQNLFDKMPKRNIISYNSLISGYFQRGVHDKVMRAFCQARMDGLKLDKFTYAGALGVCGHIRDVRFARLSRQDCCLRLPQSSMKFLGIQ